MNKFKEMRIFFSIFFTFTDYWYNLYFIEIVLSFQSMKMKKHEELETPTFTTSIPIEVNDD